MSKPSSGAKTNKVLPIARALGDPRDGGIASNAKSNAADADAADPKQNGASKGTGISIQQCEDQRTSCNAAQKTAPFQTFSLDNLGPDPAMPEFDLLCAP